MFYPNNDNYMQDLYFYNQMPNTTYGAGCPNNNSQMMGNVSNPNMNPNMMNGIYNYNQNMYGNNAGQGISNLYPSIYKIISPVISKVVANSNYQFLNEDVLNNMADTVYNIVEGQIEYDDDPSTNIQNANTQNSQTTNSNSTTSTTTTSKVTETKQVTNSQTSNRRYNRGDSLLRDIIKILILREILSRGNSQNFGNYTPYYNQPYNMNF